MEVFIGLLLTFVILAANYLVFMHVFAPAFVVETLKPKESSELALTMTFTHMNSPRLMASPRGTHDLEERRGVPGTTGVGGGK